MTTRKPSDSDAPPSADRSPFRLPRHELADLAPLRCAVNIQGEGGDCTLVNVSQGGIAVAWPEGRSLPQPGAVLSSVIVAFDGREAYRGAVMVRWVKEDGGAPQLGASFGSGLVDLERFLELRDILVWADGDGAELLESSKAWQVGASERFRARVADLRLFLEDGHESLTRLQGDFPFALADDDTPAVAALRDMLSGGFAADFVRLHREIDAAWREAGPGEQVALRAWSRRQLDTLLLTAPVAQRARSFAERVPTDVMVLRDVATRRFDGLTLFARAMQLAITQTDWAEVSRARMTQGAAFLTERAATLAPDAPLRILALGVGPAEELVSFLATPRPGIVDLVLVDPGTEALSYAWRRLRTSLGEQWGGRVRLRYQHESVGAIVDGSALGEDWHAVWCPTLLSYVDDAAAGSLLTQVSNRLVPGGRARIGALGEALPSRWLLEAHFGWSIHWRGPDALGRLGVGAVDGPAVAPWVELSR